MPAQPHHTDLSSPATPEAGHRKPLPLLVAHEGGRAAITCRYRCGDQCFHEPPNPSDNTYFRDIVREGMSRRGLLAAGAAFTVASLAGTVPAAASPATGTRPVAPAADPLRRGRPVPGTAFTPVQPNTADAITIPTGYRQDVVIRWGDPVLPGAPAFDFDKQTAAAQAKQFGYNNDFCGLVPRPGKHDQWLMGSNHEYVTEPFLFKGYDKKNPTREQVEISWAAHGFSIVAVQRDKTGKLVSRVDPTYNQRFTVKTPFRVAGPAAGSKFLRTKADPAGKTVFGTFGLCAGGVTPWGTILSGEENFHYYFANSEKISDPIDQARAKRYSLGAGTSERQWEKHDERFDLAKNPHEANRFGWVVEFDPLDPKAQPVKRTALGRFKHEGCTIRVGIDRRVVAYLGDDEKFEYIYKFVSDGIMLPGNLKWIREHNKKLLDSGTLYVAKFSGDSPAAEIDGSGKLPSDGSFDGSGQWIPLASTRKSYVPGMSVEEVFVFTRQAADKVGATKMDRPEDIETNPVNGRVYAALTNNSDRGTTGKATADEVNPRHGNKSGQVLELAERGNNPRATSFSWTLLLVCGDPAKADTYYGGYDKTKVSAISCPDNVAFDRHGNLWVSTDGNALGTNDGLFAVPVAGPERGRTKQFLTVPKGGETCGPVVTDNFVLVSVQHPGELDGASADKPVSHWPDGGASQPRPSVAVVWHPNRPIGR